jgi:hypothetical protein
LGDNVAYLTYQRGWEMNVGENTKEPVTEHSSAGIPIMY